MASKCHLSKLASHLVYILGWLLAASFLALEFLGKYKNKAGGG